jgi:hypothetical protein
MNTGDFCTVPVPQDDDEKDLVGNEEEQAEEVEEIKKNEDFKGKIHYRLEYDFTTQELKVTVGFTLTHGRRNYKDTHP